MEQSKLIRVLLVILAVPNLFAGLWALVSPQGWYDNFPGYAPQLISAYPPFNNHLVTDAGAGLFAAGAAALTAALWPRREVIIASMVAVLAFVVPHTLFHLFNPSDLLTASEDATSTASLGISVAIAAYVLGRQFIGSSTIETTTTDSIDG